MKNSKVIIVNGFCAGGTNILWNIFQSHPSVCSAILETEQILHLKYFNLLNSLFRAFFLTDIITKSPLAKLLGTGIDNRFYQLKLYTLLDSKEVDGDGYGLKPLSALTKLYNANDNIYFDNRFKYENILYKRKEVEESVLCLKSHDRGDALTNFFNKIYDNIYMIGLIRNGYAICEALVRRGAHPRIAGRVYRKFGKRMINNSRKLKNYKIVKFEDIMKDPFGAATKLFQFTQLEPTSLKKLRLKSKVVLSKAGKNIVSYGTPNKKYWFDSASIFDLLDPNIPKDEAQSLSASNRKIFEAEAKPILKYFNYLE